MVRLQGLWQYPVLAGPSFFRNGLFAPASMNRDPPSDSRKSHLRSASLEEVAAAVSAVYCPHTATVLTARQALQASFGLIRPGAQPIVELRYGAPVKVDAGQFPRLMLMQTCVDGAGMATQGNVAVACRRGQTLPLSPGLSTQLEFDARFAQRSLRVDIERIETLCARLVNHPLERTLRFELRPFSEQLETAWAQGVNMIATYEQMGAILPAASANGLDEFLLSLLLAYHPHNYSDDLARRQPGAPPRLIREAEHLMRTEDAGLTASQIAHRLGVSLRSLEAGFQEYRRTTPTRRLREIRLERVHKSLLAAEEGTSVTAIALENGFFHLPRFSSYYRAAFGEPPNATLRRSRGRGNRSARLSSAHNAVIPSQPPA